VLVLFGKKVKPEVLIDGAFGRAFSNSVDELTANFARPPRSG